MADYTIEAALARRVLATTGETLTVRVHAEDGSYWAETPEMPGLYAAGADLGELELSLIEAAHLWIDDAMDDGDAGYE